MEPRTQVLLRRLAGQVRSQRKERGLTSRVVAARAGLSPRFYAQLEAGEANIAIGRLAAVAEALGIRLSELLAEVEPPRTVALLGLRGAGKSTVGPLLAAALGTRFVELDTCVEEKAGLELREIFTIHGETYYRRLETLCLSETLEESSPCVIALSGGIVHNEQAYETVRRHCRTVWLQARPEDHMQRVLAEGDHRPVEGRANAMAELRHLLATRESLYRQSEIVIDTSSRSVPQLVEELVGRLTGSATS